MEKDKKKTGSKKWRLDSMANRILVVALAIVMTIQFCTPTLAGTSFAEDVTDSEISQEEVVNNEEVAVEETGETGDVQEEEVASDVEAAASEEADTEDEPQVDETNEATDPVQDEVDVPDNTDTEDEPQVDEKTEPVQDETSKTDVNTDTNVSTETDTEGNDTPVVSDDEKTETPVVTDQTDNTDVSGETENKQETVNNEKTEEETKAEERTWPAQKFDGAANKLNVHVEAPQGAFPAETTMKVKYVSKSDVIDAVESVIDDVEKLRAVDITFYNKDGEEIQPKKRVDVTFTSAAFDGNADLSVVHINDDGDANVIRSAEFTDTADGAQTEFKTKGFSIYIVVEEGEDARLKVKFVKLDGTTVTEMINERQIGNINQYIYDPGSGTLPEGAIFEGWTTEQNYTSETAKKTIAQVREEVIAKLQTGVHDGDEVTYYAMAFKPYTQK